MNPFKYLLLKLYAWLGSALNQPVCPRPDSVCMPVRGYVANPIRLMIMYTPKEMLPEEVEFLREVFERNIVKVGGFGGVYRADKKCVAHVDKEIQLYGTHRPFCVITEQPQRRLERGLNDIARKYIVGRSYKDLDSFGKNIGLLAYEVDSDNDQVIEAWEIPTLYWSRTDMDGRHDARLIYLDLAGNVTNGEQAMTKAQIHHGYHESDQI